MKAQIKFDSSVPHGMPWRVYVSDDVAVIDVEDFFTKEEAESFCTLWNYQLYGELK